MTTTSEKKTGGGRVAVQKFGTFLSGMIMPNIAAFIAWGFITALFIATGWWPNPILGGYGNADVIGWQGAMTALATNPDGSTFPVYVGLVGPMITYLLPLLIANTGGRMVYGERGGVVASIATVGVIVGTNIPMFLGAMIMGPLAAWLMKKVDAIWDGKIRAGFEMLVNNFSAGILGMLLAIVGFFGFGPAVAWVSEGLGNMVNWLVGVHLLPLLSIIVEPAKVLFLNNAINHGVFTPLGIAAGDRDRQVDPVPGRGEPRPRPRHPAGLHLLRCRHGQGQRARRHHHPVLRRHPRDLLPVRADEADDRSSRPSSAARPVSPPTSCSTAGCVRRRHRAASSRCSCRQHPTATSE